MEGGVSAGSVRGAPQPGINPTAIPGRPLSTLSPGRIALLRAVLPTGSQTESLISHAQELGSIPAVLTSPPSSLSVLQRAALASDLGQITDDNAPAVAQLLANPDLKTLRDVAFHFGPHEASSLAATLQANEDEPFNTDSFRATLFRQEPSAVIQRMIESAEIKLPADIGPKVSTFLKQNEDFNFRSSSLRSINIAAEEDSTHGQEVANSLATIQRVQALTSHPDALPALLNAGVSSAAGVAALPQAKFVDLFKDEIGESSARGIYDHAVKIAHRNESLLAQMHGLVRGTGLAVIDGPRTTMARMASVQEQLAASGKDVNLENLFGSMDFYDDNECSSVFSPANYLVELLQFLKNNTLDPSLDENRKPLFPNTFDPNDKNNALSILLLRRPDLQYIELTCENTNTRIPYIDLANEIMESFIVHQSDASVSWTDSKQYDIDAFNVQGESSEELLSQARYTNYTAYSIILDNGYRIGALPFHQPLTAMRIYLRFLNTSRAELLENFSQPDPDILAAGTFTPSEIAALEDLNVERRKRAVSAESLGMIPQEYNIITQESFSPKRYLEIVQRTTMSDEAYRSAVRFKALHAYWGYNSESDMLSANDTEKIGLRYVKRQFLPRSGLTYSEVAELLETGYVNEVYSFGKNSFVIQALRSNYPFLRALVEPTVTDDPERKYRRLVDWLYATYLVPFDPVRPLHFKQRRLLNLDDWTSFIHQWFDRLGKLVILELHEPKQDQDSLGPVRPPAAAFLPITGKVWLWSPESANPGPPSTAGWLIPPTSWISLPGMSPSVNQRGNLDASGRFVDSSNNLLGTVSSNSVLYKPGYQRYFSRSTGDMLLITKSKSAGIVDGNLVQLPEETVIAWVNSDDNMLRLPSTNPNEPGEMVRWLNTPTATQVAPTNIDLHGIEAARIAHLDGSDLDLEEWTRIQQFLRLKQQTGFSINELDKTVLGLSSQSSTTAAFRPVKSPQITPALVMELTVLKRLLLETQVELFQLLALFSNISMAGANSLYERLFLSNNLIGIDSVVVPDGGGNVFVANPKISDHTPVICAALHLNGAQLTAILSHASLVDATLTLVHLTWIYRYSLLSEILQVTVVELIQACQVFDLDLEKPTPTSILDFILGFRKLHGAFSIPQLRFIFKDQGLAAEFSLEKIHVLKATATISNGLASIELEYPDFNINNEPSMEDVSKLLALVYQSDLMAKITDILGDTPTQATDFYDTHLVPIFGTSDTSRNVLLGNNTLTSAVDKRKLFLLHFMPHLRQILGEKLVTEAMTALSGIDSTETVRRLLRQVLNFPAPNNSRVSALDRLLNLNSFYFQESSSWTGTIWPPTTDVYTFEGYGEIQPDAILIDGVARPFIRRQTELNNAWLTEPVNLTGGRLYSFDAAKQKVPGIKWSTSRTLLAMIPSSSLIPDAAFSFVSSVLTSLQKADICIRGLNLSQEEIDYFQSPTGRLHFKFDFGKPVFTDFQKLFTYSELRSSIASSPLSLVSLFKWATAPSAKDISDLKQIASRVAQASHWRDTDIEKLFGSYSWEKTQAADFSNEKILVRMQSALDVVHKVAVDASRLSSWASLATDFGMTKEVAVQVQSEIRSRYALEDWQQASRPLHNELRVAQRNALIAYLLDHPALQKYGIVDADSLFEFFLIDVQMGACLETSRIKQAISTIQQFIQRCILGLEEQNYPKVANYAIDQERWKWMSKQAVWTANRKVFLYPELYIEPTLRDDKSELYEVLEAELSQKDVTPESARDGLKKYLSGVHQLSDLVVQGIFKYTSSNDIVVHFVARTRSNPFSFFYRTYSLGELAWTPWMAVPIDIPTYDTASYQSLNHQSSRPPSIGNYVIPVVWQKRIFIFFAIFAPRVVPQTSLDTIQFPLPGPPAPAQTVAASKLDTLKSWQINLGWTELHNSTWSPKQVSRKAVYEDATSTSPMPMDTYKFIPFVNEDLIQIVVYDSSPKPIGAFEFRGNEAAPVTQASGTLPALLWRAETSFHFEYPFEVNANARIYSLQDYKGGPEGPGASESTPVVFHEPTGGGAWALMGDPMGWSREQEVRFSHLFVNRLFNEAKGIDSFDHIFQTLSDNFDKNKLPFGKSWSLDNQTFNEVYEPSAIYNWEIGFHAPLQLADALLKGQKFQAALDCCHYVFDPYADSKRPNDVNRVWKWKPFQEADTTSLLQGLFNQLLPGKADSLGATINKWRNNPFAPHVIARDRPQAYMKWTVMKYLEILVAYGDWYFRQGTLENLPQALQLYVLAKHLFGPAPQRLPKAGKRKPQTYFSLLSKWDAFSNALVEMELAFPFSNQLPQPIEVNGRDIASTNIFGFATARYFSVPENSQMRDLRELIDQRIFNIRHCLDIDGKSISYALWDPPINPAVLVSAIAQGMSLSSALNDLNSPMPNYRFHYILQRANELCGDLKAASSMFLGIKEKRDSEALSVLKLRQELVVENLVLDLRKMQLEEAQKAVNALKVSRYGPLSRYQYYSSLAGKTAGVLSETDSEYKEIGLQIPLPLSSGDLAVTKEERLELDQARKAKMRNDEVGKTETAASFFSALPSLLFNAQFWGVGCTISYGTQNIASAMQGHARGLRVQAETHTFNSSEATRRAGYIRQQQDRIQQANAAGHELLNINKQIDLQNQRIKIAEQEIANQQRNIDNSRETMEFMTRKYTSDELYAFLESSVRNTFYQTYTLAYDLAKKAEATYMFDRGPQAATAPFIRFGYWDPQRDGLQCGEALHLSLKQLEAAYMEKRGHDYEISKTISLRSIAPGKLMELRSNGICDALEFPEVLFDMDFPGHYMRRIKSLSVSIPCVVGPYTGVNATLMLQHNSYRAYPVDARNANSYIQKDGSDDRFVTSKTPINSIAVSSGQNDAGVFELNFNSERYLPFEGAGALSSWRLELPQAIRSFDYSTITDVLFHLKYTSVDSGGALKAAAMDTVTQVVKSARELARSGGLFALFDLHADFSAEWSRAAAGVVVGSNPAVRVATLRNLAERLPYFTRGQVAVAQKVTVFTDTEVDATAVKLEIVPPEPQKEYVFTDSRIKMEDGMKKYESGDGMALPFAGREWKVVIGDPDGNVVLKKLFLLVRYNLK